MASFLVGCWCSVYSWHAVGFNFGFALLGVLGVYCWYLVAFMWVVLRFWFLSILLLWVWVSSGFGSYALVCGCGGGV